jgi:hypothetical protein
METWLLGNGFRRLKGGMSGHVQYERGGVKIALPGYGPQDEAGFDREQVRWI